jgi:fibronectin-binding autotransporter adhesin
MIPTSHLRNFLLAAGSSLLAVSTTNAADGTWILDSNGVWSLNTNWFSNIIADGSGFTANFTNNITADRTVSLDGDRTLTNLVFGDSDTSSAGSWILNNNGTSTNNLILAGTTPTITVNALGTGKTATISAIIQGSAGLTKAGTGTLILSGANTYTGTTIVNAGTLQLGAAGVLADISNLTINSGATLNMGGFAETIGTLTLNRGTITGFGSTEAVPIITGSGGFITTGGTVANWPGVRLGGNFVYNADDGNETTANIGSIGFGGGNRTFTVADGVQAIDVEIITSMYNPGAGANSNFIKAGAGTMRISGAANINYGLGNGTTSIHDGVLQLNKSNNTNAVGGTGLVTVGDGTGSAGTAILRYVGGNDQIVSNAITINSDGLFDIADKTDTVGTVTLAGGSITSTTGVLTSTAAYALQNGSVSGRLGGNVSLNKTTTGTVTLSGTNTYTSTTTIQAGSLVAGTNSAVSTNGAFGNASSALVLGNGSTAAGDAPAVLISGAFTVSRAITVGSLSNAAAYNAIIGGSNTTGTSIFAGNITLNTTAANYTLTLRAASGGTTQFSSGTWTTNNKAIAIGSSGNAGTVRINNAIATSGGINLNFGILELNSSFTSGNLTVASGTTLSGSGSVAGTTGVTSGTINGTGLTLTGLTTFNSAANTLSGTVTTNASLASGAALALNGALTGTLNIGNGTLTGTSGSVSSEATLNGGTIELTTGTIGGTLGVTGGNWNGNGAVTGLITSSSGTFTIGNGANLTANGNLNITGGTLTAGNSSSTITGSLNYTSASSSTFAGVIAGTGKTLTLNNNSAVLTLFGDNTYTGSTSVLAGKLLIHGSTSADSAFTVNNGATLGGRGTIGGSVTLMNGATLSPGASIESLATGSNTWNGGSTVQVEFSTDGSTGAAGTEWDLLSITGTLDLSGASSSSPITLNLVSMLNDTDAGPLAVWDENANATWAGFVTTTGGITGFAADKFVFTTLNFLNTLNGTFNVSQDGNNLNLNYVTNNVIPEPKAALLGGLGLLLLLRRRR